MEKALHLKAISLPAGPRHHQGITLSGLALAPVA